MAWIPAGIRDEAVSGFVLAMGAFALRTLSTVLIGLLKEAKIAPSLLRRAIDRVRLYQ